MEESGRTTHVAPFKPDIATSDQATVIAPVTTREILGILNHPLFPEPTRIATDTWRKGIEQVRRGLHCIGDLELPVQPGKLGKGHYLKRQVCDQIDDRAKRHPELGPVILHEDSVRVVRDRLRIWISARVRVASNQQFPMLLQFIKERDGQISLSDLRENQSTRNLSQIIYDIFQLVRRDFPGPRGTEIGCLMIGECLERLSRRHVSFSLTREETTLSPRRSRNVAKAVSVAAAPATTTKTSRRLADITELAIHKNVCAIVTPLNRYKLQLCTHSELPVGSELPFVVCQDDAGEKYLMCLVEPKSSRLYVKSSADMMEYLLYELTAVNEIRS